MSYQHELLREIANALNADAMPTRFEHGRLSVERWGDWHEVHVRVNPRTRGLPSSPLSLDHAIAELVKLGLDVETIANRCGVPQADVADSLRRFMLLSLEEVEL